MKATLDTNDNTPMMGLKVFIVLIRYSIEYIIETELMNHGSVETKNAVRQDIADGKIVVIKKKGLLEIGMGSVFEDHVRENRTIYEPGDLGEIYAIALAKTLGLMILVTDVLRNMVIL